MGLALTVLLAYAFSLYATELDLALHSIREEILEASGAKSLHLRLLIASAIGAVIGSIALLKLLRPQKC